MLQAPRLSASISCSNFFLGLPIGLPVRLSRLALVSLLMLSAAAPSTGQTSVVESVHDAGSVAQGEVIEHAFKIRNDQDGPLTLIEVRPGCGCTVADFDEVIAAGATGTVRVKLDTNDFKGPIAKGVKVYTSDARNPELQLVVKANVKVFIEAQPGYSRFVYVVGEESPGDKHLLFSPSGEAFEVTGARSPYPFIATSFREAREDEKNSAGRGQQWIVELSTQSKAPVGPLADYIEVTTTSRRQPTVQIPIAGYVQPPIAVTPAEADFGERRLTEPYRSTFEVRTFSSREVELMGVESDVPGLTAEIFDLKGGKRFEVRVTLAPGMAKGAFEGTLRLRTNHVQQPLVEVPVRGRVL